MTSYAEPIERYDRKKNNDNKKTMFIGEDTNNHHNSLLDTDYDEKKRSKRRTGSISIKTVILALVSKLQSIQYTSSSRSVTSTDGKQQADTISSSQQKQTVPVITGLDTAFLIGSAPASECVTICGSKPPRYFYYMVSGFLCDIIQFIIDYTLNTMIPSISASTCWAVSFTLSIYFRHTSHRYLVFGPYVGGYWLSLGRMYAGYSIIIVISTLFNWFMTKGSNGMNHYIAYFITLIWTGIVNYFILKKLWSFGGDEKGSSSSVNVVNVVDDKPNNGASFAVTKNNSGGDNNSNNNNYGVSSKTSFSNKEASKMHVV